MRELSFEITQKITFSKEIETYYKANNISVKMSNGQMTF
jgi:hypothetical protein